MQDRISIVAQTPALVPGEVEVVITVPTFRRPDWLLETLASLRAQETDRRYAVIVIENDAEGRAGADAAAPLLRSGELQGSVIIAHERGNCFAYNAGWEHALSTYPGFTHIAVIDDDEVADPRWISHLCDAAEKIPTDIVGGPQVQMFESGQQARWSRHPVFLPPYTATGPVDALYSSGNLLLSRRVLEHMKRPFLDLSFNFLGGGDSDFLSRARVAGFRLGWCAEAPVYEKVPARRTNAAWVRARSIRNGVISTRVEKRKRRQEWLGQVKVFAHSLALAIASPVRVVARLARTGSPAIASYPFYVALGRILAEFGYAREQYREPEKH